jgi:hypothetical protein
MISHSTLPAVCSVFRRITTAVPRVSGHVCRSRAVEQIDIVQVSFIERN